MGGIFGKTNYRVTLTTSDNYTAAGTISWLYINMIGEEEGSSTGWIQLNKFLNINVSRGGTEVFDIQATDVGLPIIVKLELRHGVVIDPWACNQVIIQYGNKEQIFPLHDWVKEEVSITYGEARTAAQVKHDAVKKMREQEIEKSMVRFAWVQRPTADDLGWGIPRYVNANTYAELPSIFKFTEGQQENLVGTGFESAINSAIGSIQGFIEPLVDFDSYRNLYTFLEDKIGEFNDQWQTDEEFGRQQLNGVSPISFSRCTKLPENCQITNKNVSGLLEIGLTLEYAMESGKIYVGDYSKVYQGVNRNKNANGEDLYCPEAICLYYVNADNNMVPIAIQLVAGETNTIFTPNDSADDWLLAKMYFKVAIGNMHEWYYHFVMTHNVMEPFAVSVFRCFPRSHPMYKLLRPHLQTVSAINANARATLIQRGTSANQALAIEGADLARHTYKTFVMEDLVIPDVLKKKGLDDEKLLPKYYYRDDAIRLWKIIDSYISDVIKYYYKSDKDVQEDGDIQNFVTDMATEGLGWQDGSDRGITVPMAGLDDLIRLCTCIVYTSSVQHAAVNFQQYEYYKFVPSSPLAMRLPPHRKGEGSMTRIMNSLPDIPMSTIAITIGHLLSSFSNDEVFLGEYPMKLFTEPEIQIMQGNYRDALENFSVQTRKRNDNVDHPYKWLLPERVPNSIAI